MDKFKVVMNCCTSGNCVECARKTKFGVKLRVLHSEGITKERADLIASNWKEYNPSIKKCN